MAPHVLQAIWVLCFVAAYYTCRLINSNFPSWKLFLALAAMMFVLLEFIVPIFWSGSPFSQSREYIAGGYMNRLEWMFGWYMKGIQFSSLIYLGVNLRAKSNGSLEPTP